MWEPLGTPAEDETEGGCADQPTITIEAGKTPVAIDGATASALRWAAKPGEFLLSVDDVARYWVSGGRRIVVEAEPTADRDAIALYLYGPALCALLLQRDDVLVLHASAVALPNGSVVGFCGPSGIGKSSLAAAMHSELNTPVVTDDLCVIHLDGNKPQVAPGYPYLKLWPDMLGPFGFDPADHPLVREGVEKRFVSHETGITPHPLRHLYGLASSNIASEATIEALSGPDKLAFLRHLTHQLHLVVPFGRHVDHFRHLATIAPIVAISTVIRPAVGCSPNELASLIAADVDLAILTPA